MMMRRRRRRGRGRGGTGRREGMLLGSQYPPLDHVTRSCSRHHLLKVYHLPEAPQANCQAFNTQALGDIPGLTQKDLFIEVWEEEGQTFPQVYTEDFLHRE